MTSVVDVVVVVVVVVVVDVVIDVVMCPSSTLPNPKKKKKKLPAGIELGFVACEGVALPRSYATALTL